MALRALANLSPAFQRGVSDLAPPASVPPIRCPSPRGASSPRGCSSPRGISSPRYLQHTAASAAKLVASPRAAVPNANHLLPPAGGCANNRHHSVMGQAARFDQGDSDGPRRTLRRTLSAPRNLMGKSASPSAEAPQQPWAREPAVERSPAPAASGGLVARHDALSCEIRSDSPRLQLPRPPSGWLTSHDKSLPNAPRSRRSSGACSPGGALQVTPDALANAAPAMVSDSGFDSAHIGRRGRGLCSPTAIKPTADPNQHAAAHQAPAGLGLSASLRSTVLSPSRRGRGSCSPTTIRAGSPSFLQWPE